MSGYVNHLSDRCNNRLQQRHSRSVSCFLTLLVVAGLLHVHAGRLFAQGDVDSLHDAEPPVARSLEGDVTSEWLVPTTASVRERCEKWLEQMQASSRLHDKVLELWPETDDAIDAQAMLQRVARTAALLDSDAAQLVGQCDQSRTGPLLADHS